MAEPIQHDGMSTIATAGTEGAKWGLLGAALPFIVPVALAIATYVGFNATATAIGTEGLVSGILPGLLTIGGVFATVATTTWAMGAAAVTAIGGGLLGAFKGASRVEREGAAYREAAKGHMHSRQNKMAKAFNDGEIKGIQETYLPAYQEGYQKGQIEVVQKIQEMAVLEQQQLAGGGAAALAAPGQKQAGAAAVAMAAAEAKCVCGPETEKVIKRRKTQAIAGPEQQQVP